MEALGNETYSFSVPGHETCIPQNTMAGSPEGTSAGGGNDCFLLLPLWREASFRSRNLLWCSWGLLTTKVRKLQERSMPAICRGPVIIQAFKRLDHLPTTNEVQAGRVPSLLDFPCQGADMPSALRELLVAGTGCGFRVHPTLRIPAH